MGRLRQRALAPLQNADAPGTPAGALSLAVNTGVSPSDEFRRLYGDELADQIDRERIRQYVRPREGVEADPLAELLISGLATGGLGTAAGLAGRGAKAALGAATARTEAKAGSDALKAALTGARRTRDAVRAQGVRGAVGSAARRSRAGKATRAAGRKVPKPVRSTARAATHPIRHHPFLSAAASPVLAEAPPGGDIRAGLTGTGRLAGALGSVAKDVSQVVPGVPGNALSDAIQLPAYVLPSAYLTGAAGVEAAQGNTEPAEELWEGFLEESALPPLVTGDLGEAASRAGEHPLYAALEIGGAKALVGRGLGAAARGGKAPGERAPLDVYGDIQIPRGRYSKDAITALFQRARDRRIAARGNQATPRQAARHLRGRYDRSLFAGEQARRGAVNDAEDALDAIKQMAGGDANADALALAVQRIARNPDTAIDDLRAYRDSLVEQQANLSGGMLRANQATVDRIDRAIAHNDPEALVAAADRFIAEQTPTQQGLQAKGLFDPEQTERASAIGFLRQHEDADYGLDNANAAAEQAILARMRGEEVSPEMIAAAGERLPRNLDALSQPQLLGQLGSVRSNRRFVDSEGEGFTLEGIREALARQGADPPGMISNRLGELGRGAYYRPSSDRPSGLTQKSTGEAIAKGVSDTDFDAIGRQFMSGVSKLQQAKNYDYVTREYGVTLPNGNAFPPGTARLAIDNPGDFGVALPDIPGGWTVRKVAPWPAGKRELQGATSEGRPARADEAPDFTVPSDEGFMQDVVRRAYDGDPDGPEVIFPKLLADRERHHFSEKLPAEKTLQASTGLFKGAVLPTAPTWLAGNIADIYGVRTPIARVSIRDIRDGKGLEKIAREELTPEQLVRAMESVTPGGVFGHVRRVQPHRAADQFVGTSLEPLWRAATTLRHAPGPEQIGNLYRRYRDTVFHLENKYIERLPQYGALAKHVRQELGVSRRQFRKGIKDMEPAIRDFMRGFRNQDRVDRAAKSIESIYGNWGKNSPELRRFLTTWAPFWMWLRAATKFAWVTLPRDHPVLTSILAASEEMTREERQKLGLDFDRESEPLPAFAQGGIPLEDGGVARLANLTTFGMFTDYPDAAASMVAPQFMQGVLGGLGMDWKGDQLVDEEGRPASQEQKAKAAALSTGEAYIPFFNVVSSIVDQGFKKGVSPVKTSDPEAVEYLRSLSQSRQITVPVDGGGGSGAAEIGGSDFFDSYMDSVSPSEGGSDFFDSYMDGLAGGG